MLEPMVVITYNTNPAKKVYERFMWNPMQFYDGTKQAISAAVGVRGGSHVSGEFRLTAHPELRRRMSSSLRTGVMPAFSTASNPASRRSSASTPSPRMAPAGG